MDDVRAVYVRQGRSVVAVDGVTLSLAAGEALAIVGPSGAGKSTLARVMVGLRTPNAGSVRFDGRDLARVSASARRRLRADFQLLFQDSFEALDPRLTARACIEAPLQIHGRPRANGVEALADEVELSRMLLDRRPPQLSGGERQRVALARALALRPRLLVLDEPLAGLDPPTALALRTRLIALRAERSMAMVWITHDLADARALGGGIGVMDEGRIVEQGSVAAVFAEPAHPLTRALLQA